MSVVREFHEAFDQPAPSGLSIPDRDLLALRLRLVREEYEEVRVEFEKLIREASHPYSSQARMIETLGLLLKELADLRYVIDGAAVAFGLDIDGAFAEVHRSNMSKLGEDGRPVKREDGKVLKGPNYTEADMHQFVPPVIDISYEEEAHQDSDTGTGSEAA